MALPTKPGSIWAMGNASAENSFPDFGEFFRAAPVLLAPRKKSVVSKAGSLWLSLLERPLGSRLRRTAVTAKPSRSQVSSIGHKIRWKATDPQRSATLVDHSGRPS